MRPRLITSLALAASACVFATGASAQSVIIEDNFDDGNLATHTDTNGGFSSFNNIGSAPTASVTEVATPTGVASLAHTSGNQWSKMGIYGMNAVSGGLYESITATIEVDQFTFLNQIGNQAANDLFSAGLGNLHFGMQPFIGDWEFGIGYGPHAQLDTAQFDTTLASGNFNNTQLAQFFDPFTIVMTCDRDSWSFVIATSTGTAFADQDGTVTASGTWTQADFVDAFTDFDTSANPTNPTLTSTGAPFFIEIMKRKGSPERLWVDRVIASGVLDVNDPVLVSTEPSDSATNVPTYTDELVMTFDEYVVAGSGGDIRLYKSGPTLVETFTPTSPNVTISANVVTIEPTNALDLNTTYYVEVDGGALEDTNGLTYDGFLGNGTWSFTTQTSVPSIDTLDPVDGATGVAVDSDLVITFDDSVTLGTGYITIRAVDRPPVEIIDVTGGSVTVDGAEVTIDLAGTLVPGVVNYVEIDPGAIVGYGGFSGSGTWSFTAAGTAPPPVLIYDTFDNADLGTGGSNAVNGGFNSFNNIGSPPFAAVTEVTTPTSVASLAHTSGNKWSKMGIYGMNSASGELYESISATIEVDEFTFLNSIGNDFANDLFSAGLGNLHFGMQPFIGDWEFGIGYGPHHQLDTAQFDTTLASGNFNNTQLAQFFEPLTISFTGDRSGWSFVIATSTGTAFTDQDGTVTATGTWTQSQFLEAFTDFDTSANPTNPILSDSGAPFFIEIMKRKGSPETLLVDSVIASGVVDVSDPVLVSTDPVDTATNVPVNQNLLMTFDEDVVKGSSGDIRLVKSGTVVETFTPTAANVTISGNVVSIDPTSLLDVNTTYYIEVDGGALEDVTGLTYDGFSGSGTWSFTTQTTVPSEIALSPVNTATGVALDTNLVITFDESVSLGTGNITIKALNDAIVEIIDVTTGSVTVDGAEVTINPVGNLLPGIVNYVEIDPGAISGYAGFSGSGTWSFTTVGRTLPSDVVFFDDFDNTDLGTGGPNAVASTGFNRHGTWTGSDVSENGTKGTVAWDDTATIQYEHVGMTSKLALDLVSQGSFMATWKFESVTFPTGDLDNFKVGIGNLFWTNQKTNYSLGIGYGDRHNYTTTLIGTTSPANFQSELEDGFSVVLTCDQTGWTLEMPGTSTASSSGTWAAAGTTYDAVFGTTFIRAGDSAANINTTDAVILNEAMRRVSNPFQSDIDYIMVQSAAEGYNNWASDPGGNFVGTLTDTDPTLDFDKGGLPTGIEWVLDGDPTDGSDDGGIAPTGTPTAGGGLVFVFRRSDAANDDSNTAISVEYGSNLAGWTAANPPGDGTTMVEEDDYYGTGVDRVTVTIPGSKAANGRLFARLRVDITL